MSVNTKVRDPYIDVVKGIGIFSIVIGHASWDLPMGSRSIPIGPFVYLYHLAIFFFCSGYLYKEDITDFWGYVAKKLKGLYKPFVIYCAVYFLFRNFFIHIGIVQGEKFTLGTLGKNLTNALAFYSIGEMLSAFWFVPVLFFALTFYTAVIYLTAKINNQRLREVIRIGCYLIFGCAGLIATERGYGLLYSMQIVYLMIPVIALGHYFAMYKETFKNCINIVGLLISFIGLVWVLRLDIGIIELSRFMIINRYVFYPVTLCGIWFCLCLGKLLCNSKWLTKWFALAGSMSFDIMALHFLAFKIIDYMACLVTGQMDRVGVFPHTFTRAWPVYYVAGMVLPIVIRKAVDYLYGMLLLKIGEKKEREWMKKIIERKNIIFLIIFSVFLITFSVPIIKQGIMCNDELILRLLRKRGLFEFWIGNVRISASKGRMLGAIFNTKILSYVSANMFVSRIVNCIWILVTVLAARYLVYTLTREKYFSNFVGILLLAFIPITYENALPNAHVSVMCVPMTLLFFSLSLLMKAIQLEKKKKNFTLSMILLFFALVMYEFVITFSPLYWIIIFVYSYQKGETFFAHIKKAWKDYLIPVLVCVGYLLLYVGGRQLLPTGYGGNSIGFISIKESAKIIIQLLKSAIPGYYFFNDKYRFLMNFDNGMLTLENLKDARFILMLVSFILLLVWVYVYGKKERITKQNKISKRLPLVLVGMLATVLPTLPISISALSQGTVNEKDFVALPVSFCIYFAEVFVIALLAWEFVLRTRYIGIVVVGSMICLVFSQIQVMNNAFSQKQYEYFTLLESQEEVFETDTMKSLNIETLYASDLFITHYTLAFHDSYWSELASVSGNPMKILNDVGAEADWRLYSDEERVVSLTNGKDLFVFTDKYLEGEHPVKIMEEQEITVNLSNGYKDNEKYVYTLEIGE